GGVCFFLWKRDEPGLCRVYSYSRDKDVSVMERPLLEDGCETFIRYNEGISILNKVQAKGEPSMVSLISARKPFGLDTTYKGKSKYFAGSIKLYQNGGVGYIDPKNISANRHLIKLYKVMIPPLGSGSDSFPHPILGRPFVVEPNTACTETYLVAGSFNNKKHTQHLAGYLMTRFLRFLVLLNKPTQHATSKVYAFVPLQDFSESWTDKKLYKKYGLTKDEIAFIESMVRPMEAKNE
ncbi:MAG: restriction endonuclease, partial [Thermodesulfobacteriota bacterium]|nr:restriction endonuclease [Thermodesulfobacteriota bacterium]